jgi:hypothetical protein
LTISVSRSFFAFFIPFHGRHDEIFDHPPVARGQDLLLDLHRDDFLDAVQLHRDHAAARGRLDDAVLEVLLDLGEAFLHVLELLIHGHVWSPGYASRITHYASRGRVEQVDRSP